MAPGEDNALQRHEAATAAAAEQKAGSASQSYCHHRSLDIGRCAATCRWSRIRCVLRENYGELRAGIVVGDGGNAFERDAYGAF